MAVQFLKLNKKINYKHIHRFIIMNYELVCGDLKKYNEFHTRRRKRGTILNINGYPTFSLGDILYTLHQYLFTNYAADTIVRFIRYRYRIRKIEIQKELQKILIKDLAGDVIRAF